MFKSIVAQAKRAVTDTAERLLGRAVVGLLLVVAAGFATAALMIKLTEAWGAVIACLVVAGMFALIALIAAAVISASEQHAAAEPQSAAEVEAEAQGDDIAGTITSLVASDPLTMVSAAGTAAGVFRALGRRTSLLILALLAAAFIWSRTSGEAAPETAAEPPPAPAE